MQKTVIRIVENALGWSTPDDGRYIASFEPDTDELGRGTLRTTSIARDALHFDNGAAAMQFWRQQSMLVPLRPDGKPNRPLTAYTVVIEPMEFGDE